MLFVKHQFSQSQKTRIKHLTRWRFFSRKTWCLRATGLFYTCVVFAGKSGAGCCFAGKSALLVFATQQTDRYSSVCVFCETLVFARQHLRHMLAKTRINTIFEKVAKYCFCRKRLICCFVIGKIPLS